MKYAILPILVLLVGCCGNNRMSMVEFRKYAIETCKLMGQKVSHAKIDEDGNIKVDCAEVSR